MAIPFSGEIAERLGEIQSARYLSMLEKFYTSNAACKAASQPDHDRAGLLLFKV